MLTAGVITIFEIFVKIVDENLIFTINIKGTFFDGKNKFYEAPATATATVAAAAARHFYMKFIGEK